MQWLRLPLLGRAATPPLTAGAISSMLASSAATCRQAATFQSVRIASDPRLDGHAPDKQVLLPVYQSEGLTGVPSEPHPCAMGAGEGFEPETTLLATIRRGMG